MMDQLSSWLVCGPKFIVPRQSRLTSRPVRPRLVYSMPPTYPRRRGPPRSAALARGRPAEQHVIPAGQALARLFADRLVAAGGCRGGVAAGAEHGERRHGRDLLGRIGILVERRAADQRGGPASAR